MNREDPKSGNLRIPFDFKFIEKFVEPLSQKIQRLVGLDCFFFAKLLMKIALPFDLVNIGVCVWLMTVDKTSEEILDHTFCGLIFLWLFWRQCIVIWCQKTGLDAISRRVYLRLEKLQKNKLIFNEREWFPLPVLFGVISSLFFRHFALHLHVPKVDLLMQFVLFVPWILNYLAQCLFSSTPLPPATSKVKKWWKALKLKDRGVLSGGGALPEPQPA